LEHKDQTFSKLLWVAVAWTLFTTRAEGAARSKERANRATLTESSTTSSSSSHSHSSSRSLTAHANANTNANANANANGTSPRPVATGGGAAGRHRTGHRPRGSLGCPRRAPCVPVTTDTTPRDRPEFGNTSRMAP